MSVVAQNVSTRDGRQPEYQVAYGTVLGAIGVRLDAERRCQVRVIETDKGFIVSSSGGSENRSPTDRVFSHADLHKDRRTGQSRRPSFLGGRKPGRYERLLRQIGCAVEGMVGYTILIDEWDQGFFASYQYYAAESGFMLHKHCMSLDSDGLPRRLTPAEEGLFAPTAS